MENGEKMFIKLGDVDSDKIGVDDSGYSEKKSDKDTELQAGQWLDLKQTSKPKQQKPQKQVQQITKPSAIPSGGTHRVSLLNAITDINSELADEVKGYLLLVQEGNDESEQVLQRITSHQAALRALLKAIKWEQKGNLDISKLPKDVQNLLK